MSDYWLANLVLIVHVLFVGFVVLGLLLIVLGGALHWRWVRNRWFRLAHLAAIAFVVAETWLGYVCPLTSLEARLRGASGFGYNHGFIAYWLHHILYFTAAPWVFTLSYTLFFLLVIATLVLVPVRWRGRQQAARS